MNTELHIERLDLKARGIAEHDGVTYVCDGALPGETVRVNAIEQRRRLALARNFSVLAPVPARTRPVCSYYGECGGCQLQHSDVSAQRRYKQALLEHALQYHGGVRPAAWQEPIVGAGLHYRRRARLRVRFLPNGELIIGFNRKHRSWLLDIQTCAVLEAKLETLLVPLHELVNQLSVQRRLPQIELVGGDAEIAVVFRHLQAMTQSDRERLAAFAECHAVRVFTQAGDLSTLQPLNPQQSTMLFYSLPAHDVRLGFAPTDFIQANAPINQALVDAVIEKAQLGAEDQVLDLYCGVGNFGLPAARYTESVIGVEGHAGLIERARRNARDNAITNARFIEADLCQWQPDVHVNKVVLDPPREGAIAILKRLAHKDIEKIIYVSCDPKSLARDARYLVGRSGYCFTQARLVDMFPQTRHIETLAVFEK